MDNTFENAIKELSSLSSFELNLYIIRFLQENPDTSENVKEILNYLGKRSEEAEKEHQVFLEREDIA